MRKVIINSTPLIALCKAGRLELLKAMYGEVTIPDAVFREVTEKSDSVQQSLVENSDWIHVGHISEDADRKMYKAKLHAGEVEVMILAQETNADLVVIDDLEARKTADYLGLTLTGTIGILLKAKQLGHLSQVMPVIKEMERQHIYFSEALLAKIKRLANE